MKTLFERKRGNGKLVTFLLALAVTAAGAGSPAFGDADSAAKIAKLEKALAAIKASMLAGEDVDARIAELEAELEQLKAESAAPEAAAPATRSELPAAGLQGAPNPLQDDKRYLTGQDLLDESFPNSIPIPGTKTRFAVGGYAKLDFIHDFDYVGDKYEFELATIPVEGTQEASLGGLTTAHAKESRINFDFRRRVQRGEGRKDYPLQAFVEIDFFDDRDLVALQPRLRHAYGVIGRLLAGRTWTTSGDLEALAGTIDFSGGDALYGDRVSQVRFQDRAGDHVTWAVAVEEPKTSISNPSGLAGAERPQLPNLAGRVRWTAASGSHLQLGADLFRLEWQGGDAGPSDTEFGYGLNLTGRWLVGGNGNNTIVGGGTIGEGAAHRVVPFSGGGNDAVITASGLDTISHWQAYVGYSHYWTRSLNSTLSTNWAALDNSEFQTSDALHRVGSVHLNLIWFPYKLVSTGVEVMWGERVDNDGAQGEAWRLQYMAKYKFN